MNPKCCIFDVTDTEFEQQVIENSFYKPVLVDFWANGCAPCKALLPILSQITDSYQGELLLAKVNSDTETITAQRLGIRSIPTVVLFWEGQPLDGFVGIQPESTIRAMLKPYLKIPNPPVVTDGDIFQQAKTYFNNAQFSASEQLLQQLLMENSQHSPGQILYAQCLAERGELDQAKNLLDAIDKDEHPQALAAAQAQLSFLRQARSLPDTATLKSRLAQTPEDVEASYQLAIQQLTRQQYEPALEALMQLITKDCPYVDGSPQKTLQQAFALLGDTNPLVTRYQRQLQQHPSD